MIRAFDLSEKLKTQGFIKSIQERDIHEDDIRNAKEVMMIGTTLDVLPVSSFEGAKIGEGHQGPVAKEMLKLLRADIKNGPKATAVYA